MTDYMNALIEEHIDCVQEVIARRIRVPNLPLLEYDDLYQVGCEALCKAAQRFCPEKGEFKPFACTVIYNSILAYCDSMYIRNRGKVDIDFTCDNDSFAILGESKEARRAFDDMLDKNLMDTFHACHDRYTGITRCGIEAMEMKLLGFTPKEIAAHFHTTTNNVNAWISRARSKLKNDPELTAALR